MEAIIVLILIVLFGYAVFYGSIFFVVALVYGYWGFSIGMAPVVWIIFAIGMIVGFVVAFRNAIKAIKKVYFSKKETEE